MRSVCCTSVDVIVSMLALNCMAARFIAAYSHSAAGAALGSYFNVATLRACHFHLAIFHYSFVSSNLGFLRGARVVAEAGMNPAAARMGAA
jgi:hypothetical protein